MGELRFKIRAGILRRLALRFSAGFTLVEVLVAIFILGVALTATFYIINVNLQNANAIRNNIISSGLLQEGIEVVRNIRDRDWHLSNAFGYSLPNGTYRIQWDSIQCNGSGSPVGCSSPPFLSLGSNPPLKKDSATGLYNYSTGTDTIFKRTVEITTVSGAEKKIEVTVTWGKGSIVRSVSSELHLFDWK